MRKVWTAAALVCLMTVFALAASKPDTKKANSSETKKEEKKLKAGDAAPSLKVSKWLQGQEVPKFVPGKVYVVEFWATWCGPCIVMMPHLGELQSEYKDKGVTVIGFTSRDPNNTAEKVVKFVSKRGPKLGYTFAYGDNEDTYNAWMTAADRHGIPCSFVIDQKGKIAYIGHPLFLGEVLPKVVAEQWNVDAGARDLEDAEKDLNHVFREINGSDTAASLKALADFEKKRPGLANVPFFVGPKIMLLIKAKKFDEAKQLADAAFAKAIDQEDPGALRTLASLSGAAKASGQKALIDLTLKAADTLLKISDADDWVALVTVAQANFDAGNKEKAREFGKKALEATADKPEGLRNAVKRMVKRFDDKPTKEKEKEKEEE